MLDKKQNFDYKKWCWSISQEKITKHTVCTCVCSVDYKDETDQVSAHPFQSKPEVPDRCVQFSWNHLSLRSMGKKSKFSSSPPTPHPSTPHPYLLCSPRHPRCQERNKGEKVQRDFFLFFLATSKKTSFPFTYPLTACIIGAPQMTSQPFSSIFLCSPLPSRTWWAAGLSIRACKKTGGTIKSQEKNQRKYKNTDSFFLLFSIVLYFGVTNRKGTKSELIPIQKMARPGRGVGGGAFMR